MRAALSKLTRQNDVLEGIATEAEAGPASTGGGGGGGRLAVAVPAPADPPRTPGRSPSRLVAGAAPPGSPRPAAATSALPAPGPAALLSPALAARRDELAAEIAGNAAVVRLSGCPPAARPRPPPLSVRPSLHTKTTVSIAACTSRRRPRPGTAAPPLSAACRPAQIAGIATAIASEQRSSREGAAAAAAAGRARGQRPPPPRVTGSAPAAVRVAARAIPQVMAAAAVRSCSCSTHGLS